MRRLERDIFPWLEKKAILSITPHEILVCVQRIENRGALETAHQALQNCGQVMRYAVATASAYALVGVAAEERNGLKIQGLPADVFCSNKI